MICYDFFMIAERPSSTILEKNDLEFIPPSSETKERLSRAMIDDVALGGDNIYATYLLSPFDSLTESHFSNGDYLSVRLEGTDSVQAGPRLVLDENTQRTRAGLIEIDTGNDTENPVATIFTIDELPDGDISITKRAGVIDEEKARYQSEAEAIANVREKHHEGTPLKNPEILPVSDSEIISLCMLLESVSRDKPLRNLVADIQSVLYLLEAASSFIKVNLRISKELLLDKTISGDILDIILPAGDEGPEVTFTIVREDGRLRALQDNNLLLSTADVKALDSLIMRKAHDVVEKRRESHVA
jgi:hypothetical protein